MLVEVVDFLQKLRWQEVSGTPLRKGCRELFEHEAGFRLVDVTGELAQLLTFAFGEVVRHRRGLRRNETELTGVPARAREPKRSSVSAGPVERVVGLNRFNCAHPQRDGVPSGGRLLR